jgi:hypothetical protein
VYTHYPPGLPSVLPGSLERCLHPRNLAKGSKAGIEERHPPGWTRGGCDRARGRRHLRLPRLGAPAAELGAQLPRDARVPGGRGARSPVARSRRAVAWGARHRRGLAGPGRARRAWSVGAVPRPRRDPAAPWLCLEPPGRRARPNFPDWGEVPLK